VRDRSVLGGIQTLGSWYDASILDEAVVGASWKMDSLQVQGLSLGRADNVSRADVACDHQREGQRRPFLSCGAFALPLARQSSHGHQTLNGRLQFVGDSLDSVCCRFCP
jgi:hypothetical protein